MPSSFAHSSTGRSRLSLPSDFLLQARDVPGLRIGVVRNVFGDEVVDDARAHILDRRSSELGGHHLAPVLEDDLALVVHHVVELENVLANVEVARLDLLLRLLQRLVDPRMDDRLVLLEAEALEHRVHALGAENAHEVVLQRQEELRPARIALAAGTSAQLVVDAAALVPLGADDVEAAGVDRLLLEIRDFRPDRRLLRRALLRRRVRVDLLLDAHLDIAAELDVGAAAGHVGGDGDRARDAGLGDDEGLLLMEAGVENREVLRRLARARRGVERLQRVGLGKVDLLVAVPLQHFAEHLGFLDRRRADQHRLHLGVGGLDLAHDGAHLFVGGAVDLVVLVETRDRPIGRDLDDDRACRSRRIRRPRSRRCRSCRQASCRGGNSSGR